MDRKRSENIDFLRSIAIIGVIATHVLSYNLTNPLNFFIWNYLHFVVVLFVFCSGYVLTLHYKNNLTTASDILKWYKKRFVRLLVPFYIYLLIHYLLWILFPHYFSGLGLTKNLHLLLQSIFFIGGIDLNWLPLLFLQLTLLFPLFIKIFTKKTTVILYVLAAIGVTAYFTISPFPHTYYRLVMFIPWSLILLYSMYISKKEQMDTDLSNNINRYFKALFVGAVVFISLFVYYSSGHISFVLTNHKYPPDFYYLSYAFTMSLIMIIASKLHIVEHIRIKRISYYISNNSYQLFFIHYIFLDFTEQMSKQLSISSPVLLQFIFVLTGSLLMIVILNKSAALLKKI